MGHLGENEGSRETEGHTTSLDGREARQTNMAKAKTRGKPVVPKRKKGGEENPNRKSKAE